MSVGVKVHLSVLCPQLWGPQGKDNDVPELTLDRCHGCEPEGVQKWPLIADMAHHVQPHS